MKLRRSPSMLKAHKLGGYPSGSAPASGCSSRLRVVGFYLFVFLAGSALTAGCLSLVSGDQVERAVRGDGKAQERLGVQPISRRGLYTSAKGAWVKASAIFFGY